nr:Mu transposase C-terminal domain-containing protein [Paraburkholderia sp. BL8N3]
MLADLGVCKLNRPAKTPRAGQVAESGNRKDDNNIISNLPGNRLNIDDFRKLCEGFRPNDNEVLSLGTIRVLLERVYFEVEPKHISSRTNGETVEKYETRLLEDAGTSHIPQVPYTNELRVRCMPKVDGRSGNRIITTEGGVECNKLQYFASVLKQPGMAGKFVEVHYDPDNVGHVFVWLKRHGGWVECFCDEYEVLSQFTSVELDEYTAYLGEKGVADKVKKRRNRAMAYAEVLSEAKSSNALVLMHEAAREAALECQCEHLTCGSISASSFQLACYRGRPGCSFITSLHPVAVVRLDVHLHIPARALRMGRRSRNDLAPLSGVRAP